MHKGWPALYNAKVRVGNIKKQAEEVKTIPMLLPHEILAALARSSDLAALCDLSSLYGDAAAHMENAKVQLQDQNLVALGLWGDGCPCNWDRSESLEVFSLSLPGVKGHENLRIPLAAIQKRFLLKFQTFDDILQVVTWSLKFCALGIFPTRDVDDSEFQSAKRRQNAGKSLGAKGCLAQVKGDWKFMKECFRFPGWKEKKNCCWKCHCSSSDISVFV